MYIHPDIAANLARGRQRDLRADMGSHRLPRELRELASAARRDRISPHRLRRAWHPVLRLRAHARRSALPAAGAARPTSPA